MCARRPTSAMPKPFLCCERAFCCSMVVMWPVLMHVMSFDVVVMSFDQVLLQYYSVLQSTTALLLCTTNCYSSTTLYCKVLLQYYSVLHSTTTYYSVLQSTTPVLLCTAKYYSSTTEYYSSTTLYHKAAFKIDPWHIWTVIYIARSNRSHPPTSPNTAPATQNESHDWSASDMKRHLQCAEQQESQSNFTKYCACHAKSLSW